MQRLRTVPVLIIRGRYMAYGNFRKTEIIEEIGSELRKARKAKKYTLGELSQQLSVRGMNLSPELLSRMENGERRIDDDTLEAVCGILEADAAAVVAAAAREHIRRISEGAEKREEPAAGLPESLMTDQSEILEKVQPESSVTELYRNLNPEGQREVSRLMRLMAYMETFRKV